jgi:YaiO family outer membrane protein
LYRILNYFLLIYLFSTAILHAAEYHDCNETDNRFIEQMGKIDHFAVNKELNVALGMTEAFLQTCPESKQIHLLYAKLLFWDTRFLQAKKEIEPYRTEAWELYQKIYTAWALQRLNEIEGNEDKQLFIETLEPFAKRSYDILWIEIQVNIAIKNFKRALQCAAILAEKYPESREAQVRFATLLFWNGKYQESLVKYQQLNRLYAEAYTKEEKQLQTIIMAKEYHKRRAVQKSVIQKQKQKPVAVTPVIKHPPVQKKKRVVEPEIMDKKHLAEHMVGIGFQRASYSDDRYRDRTNYVEMALPIQEYTLYLKVQDTDRYRLNDKKILGEFYPKLPDPQWGYLSFSYTPDTDFFSHYSIGWHHFYGWKNWQFGVGYEWSRYKEEDISLLSAEYSYYFNDFLFIRQVLYFVPDNHSWACKNELKYQTPEHFEWYIDYIVSHSNEEISETNIMMGTDIDHLQFGGEYPVTKHYTIGGNAGREWMKDERNTYSRNYVEFFIRLYW